MSNIYQDILLETESDVEQKFIYKLLTTATPDGLGYSESDFKTKVDIRKIAIDKGTKKKLYYPDYAIVVDGLPVIIIEAKSPGESISDAIREARLYATEINSSYQRNVNPCEKIFVTNGLEIAACYWDEDKPTVSFCVADMDQLDPNFSGFVDSFCKDASKSRARAILGSIKSTSRYYKPIQMLGGKTVANETVGDNSFGANISIEYKYLFNPERLEDRASIVKNAYVKSKRKQAHIAPIDKIIRAAMPQHVIDARHIEDSEAPKELLDEIRNTSKIRNEICLLIGSVGSGKSTFTDYLRLEALPRNIASCTDWININLNKSPLSRDKIYDWVVHQAIKLIGENHADIDFSEMSVLKKIYSVEIGKVERGKASLYPKGSDKYIDIIFNEVESLQRDDKATLRGMINFLHKDSGKLLVVVLDNCDKRNRDDQLLMFEVAAWLKNEFQCMVFLPLRDTTYDQYRDEPPLDTVIKDLVFRIDPPLLETVIQSRLSYVLREIGVQNNGFVYYLPNGIRVECARAEVGDYLKSMISSLFQDHLFKRIITGLAGRNIRKGLEILLDFCKSGHVGVDHILKTKTSSGEYKLPNHLIAKILFKGKRKYYSDQEAYIKNLFFSDELDPLPDPFVRISILQWLKNNHRIYGPNRTMGFHKVGVLNSVLQGAGHSGDRVMSEMRQLISAGCIVAESQTLELSSDDLISLSPAGFIHLDLLRNVNYLSTMSEDVLFRENQVAKSIADNLTGAGKFKLDSRSSSLSNSKCLIDYMSSYHENFFVGNAKILNTNSCLDLINMSELSEFVVHAIDNDETHKAIAKFDSEYPAGTLIEAQVMSIQSYGMFVEFGLEGRGLIHKTQLIKCERNLDDFESGDWVTVEVEGFNSAHNKFDLKFVLMQN